MTSEYDVVVVGGGIHGAGVAQAAAAAGHSILVLEQTAIASGTSSRSSKLIHGGLRYLESLQYSLVRESLNERRLLLKLAPDLVHLVPFYIPVYKSTHRRPWQIRAGLSLYAVLGGMATDNRFSTVPRSSWDKLDGIKTHDLQAVYCYRDGQTDDAALTRAVMRSAQNLGAELAVPAVFLQASLGPEHVLIHYQRQGDVHSCKARVLINAGGPWVNHVLEKITPAPRRRTIDLVRGTHIRVSGPIQSGIYYMETPQDGRAVFAMPREGSVLVGTTETIATLDDPAKVTPTREEQDYLLKVLAHYFPYYRAQENQTIISSFAGLRVLQRSEDRAFDRSRETGLVVDREVQPRLLSIYGGKLTTWRTTAEKALVRISAGLPVRPRRVRTDQLTLSPD